MRRAALHFWVMVLGPVPRGVADAPLPDPPLADPLLALACGVVSWLAGGDACWDED